MAINLGYGNPKDVYDMATNKLRQYYQASNNPSLYGLQDTATTDAINNAGAAKLATAYNSMPRNGQIGSAGNRLTTNTLSGIMAPVASTYTDLATKQNAEQMGNVENYTKGALGLNQDVYQANRGNQDLDDRIKQFTYDMAQKQKNREWQNALADKAYADQKELMTYKNKLNSGWGFWGSLLGGLGKLGAGLVTGPAGVAAETAATSVL